MSKLYKPVIVRKEVNDEHFYFVDGKFFPSVTKILDETMPMPFALRHWLGEVGNDKANEKLQKAGDRGSAIHKACEFLLGENELSLIESFEYQAGRYYTFTEQDKMCIVGFINWANAYKPVVKNIEMQVASSLGYAGTLDLYCEIDGKPWIIDFKTSAGIYDSHKLQVAAYQNAFKEMTGIEAKTGILHLTARAKNGYLLYDVLEIKDKTVSIDDFMAVFQVYLVLNGGVIKEPDLADVYPERVKLYE